MLRERLGEFRFWASPLGTEAAGIDTRNAAPGNEQHDRIVSVVSRFGGRVRQRTIVAETGWSQAKVSRLLGDMETTERIARVAVGREKIVVFPEQLPTTPNVE